MSPPITPADTSAQPDTPTMPDCKSGQSIGPAWHVGWATAMGLYHEVNQDSLRMRRQGRLRLALAWLWLALGGRLWLALGDGVSGGAAGEYASRAAVKHACALPSRYFGRLSAMKRWMSKADAAVQSAVLDVTTLPGATTLTAAWLDSSGRGWLHHVGDSRIHHVTNDAVIARTRDHTFEEVGPYPPPLGVSPDSLSWMLGTEVAGPPEIEPVELLEGEGLLLSTDGLHAVLSPTQLLELLQKDGPLDQAESDLAQRCKRLVEAAQQAGSKDDISVMLVMYRGKKQRIVFRDIVRFLQQREIDWDMEHAAKQ